MSVFNMHDAKTNLSDLVARAEAGEEIVIARRNVPVVKLLPLPAPDTRPSDPAAQPGFDPFEPAPDDFISKQAIAAYYRKYPQEWREMTLMVGFGETGQAEYEAAAIGEAVETGREVPVLRDGRTIARVVPEAAKAPRVPGRYAHLRGKLTPDIFDAPLPEGELAAWEGEESPDGKQ